jgi:hypothetical protein
MPPSQENEDLMTAMGIVDVASASGTTTIHPPAPLTQQQAPAMMSLALQDQLSNVFEAKMTMSKEENAQNIGDTSVAITAGSDGSHSSNSSVVTFSADPPESTQQSSSTLEPDAAAASEVPNEPSTCHSDFDETNDNRTSQNEAQCEESTTDSGAASEQSNDNKQEDGSSIKEVNGQDQESSSTQRDGPLAMLRKGAVAAVGGTMVRIERESQLCP